MAENAGDYNWEPERDLLRALLPRAGAVVDYLTAIQQRRAQRVEQLMSTTLDLTGASPEAIVAKAEQDPEFAHLLVMILEGAQQALRENKIRGFSRALTMGYLADDSAQVDRAQLMSDTISSLEVVHVRALQALVSVQADESYHEGGGPSLDVALPEPLRSPAVQSPILKRLETLGLLELDPPGFGGWWVTEFGRDVYRFLEDPSD